jgi:hypothetical protein
MCLRRRNVKVGYRPTAYSKLYTRILNESYGQYIDGGMFGTELKKCQTENRTGARTYLTADKRKPLSYATPHENYGLLLSDPPLCPTQIN